MSDDKKNEKVDLALAHAGDPQAEIQRDLTGSSQPALTTTGGVKQPDPDAPPAPATVPGPDKPGSVTISREIIEGLYGRIVTIAQTLQSTRPEPRELPGLAASLHKVGDDLLAQIDVVTA